MSLEFIKYRITIDNVIFKSRAYQKVIFLFFIKIDIKVYISHFLYILLMKLY